MDSSKKTRTRAEWEAIANFQAEGYEWEEIEAAQTILGAMDGDLQDGLRILIALADESLREYEQDQGGRVYGTYIVMALGSGVLPDGREVGPGRTLYVGRSRDIARREKLHRQDAQLTRPRTAPGTAIKALRAQDCDVYFHCVSSELTLDESKAAEAALVRTLVKAGAPLVNIQLIGEAWPED